MKEMENPNEKIKADIKRGKEILNSLKSKLIKLKTKNKGFEREINSILK